MEAIEGGRLEPGDEVLAYGRPAKVVCSNFRTHVFREDVSVVFEDGERDLVPRERVERSRRRKDGGPLTPGRS